MKNVCVFCSTNKVEKKYVDVTEELGRLIAKNNFNLVWGGGNRGLMKVISDSVQNNGGKIFGVTIEFLKDFRKTNADEMIITKDFPERKKLLLKKADAIILLPGGVGSLDEITEVIELKKHSFHFKPVVVLNTDKFYEGLKIQLQRMEKDGFLTKALDEFLYFADTPSEAIDYIKKFFKN
ncbi:MAG: TIGR00730 family Rossman fold protein [Candidatus Roizmanbacteria bacterium]|nr:TIGR00730 family Rossman fold protein [Candidatus Roizmanbacteria bacterium]